MVPVTLTAKEFETIHNALWYLSQVDKPEVQVQVEAIRGALKGAYEQERQISDRKYDHYSQVKKDLGLDAIWSVTEVDNLSEPHPYEGVKYVTYKQFWGEGIVTKAINGNTWAALYVAANACIRDSGDDHHVFIEDFRKSGESLLLTTGS
jgi:hypothetical protein